MKGTIKKWDESKGFGFIKPAQGKDIFVHTSDCRPRLASSSVGKEVEYKISKDSKGRECAIKVRLAGHKERKSPPRLPVVLGLGYLGFLGYAVHINRYPVDVIGIIGIASLLSIFAYAKDKSAALKGNWRVSENTLHIFSLLGGWPGAAIGQTLFNHKTSKQPFRSIFWMTVVLNVAFVGWTFTNNGEYFLYMQLMDFKQALREIISNLR